MKKLYCWIQKWFNGEEVKGIKNVALDTRYEIAWIYTEIKNNKNPEFINAKCKEILDKAGVKTIEHGIGWKVVS